MQQCGCRRTWSEPATGSSGRAFCWHSSAGRVAVAVPLPTAQHTEKGILHALWPPLKGSEGLGLSGDRDKLKVAASSGAAPKRTEVDFHGQSVLLA